jgi:hypothetical protein
METNIGSDLIIGGSSQIAKYMPANYHRVSGRLIPDYVFSHKWKRVYICFSEQRTSLANDKSFKSEFYDVNLHKTLSVINKLTAQKIICFSTTELWNMCNGVINLNTPYNFKENYYTESKLLLTTALKKRENVITLYPFNFNSKFRSETFLFGKIFDSLINNKKIEIGSTYYYREILHARYVASSAITATSTKIIGSGRLIHVNDYIKDLYMHAKLDYNKLVIESEQSWRPNTTFWLDSTDCQYSYVNLLEDSMEDL